MLITLYACHASNQIFSCIVPCNRETLGFWCVGSFLCSLRRSTILSLYFILFEMVSSLLTLHLAMSKGLSKRFWWPTLHQRGRHVFFRQLWIRFFTNRYKFSIANLLIKHFTRISCTASSLSNEKQQKKVHNMWNYANIAHKTPMHKLHWWNAYLICDEPYHFQLYEYSARFRFVFAHRHSTWYSAVAQTFRLCALCMCGSKNEYVRLKFEAARAVLNQLDWLLTIVHCDTVVSWSSVFGSVWRIFISKENGASSISIFWIACFVNFVRFFVCFRRRMNMTSIVS